MEFTRGSDCPEERETVLPPPPPENDGPSSARSHDRQQHAASGSRLWIGNLDFNITEYTLLKLVERYGPLEKFDFMYHLGPGSNRGKPRGYCFVTYADSKDANRALRSLNGKLLLTRKLVVRQAADDAGSRHPSARSVPGMASTTAPTSTDVAGVTDPVATAARKRKLIADLEEQLRRISADQGTQDAAVPPKNRRTAPTAGSIKPGAQRLT